jgi:phytoene synthase
MRDTLAHFDRPTVPRPGEVARAFRIARSICRRHAKSFYFSSFFLPRDRREAAYAVYAFCRQLDDSVDDALPGDAGVDGFLDLLDRIYPPDALTEVDRAGIAPALAQTVRQFDIPRPLFVEIAEGCRMDLHIARYATWADLQHYCHRVAGAVGLIMCRILGLTHPPAEQQAAELGIAMQLTNILRDIPEDLARGRIYLPQDELTRFGVTESDLTRGQVTEGFCALMRFQITRARTLYTQAATGLQHLPPGRPRFTAAAMAALYSGILDEIERANYDVFRRRARLSLLGKLARLRLAWRLSAGSR